MNAVNKTEAKKHIEALRKQIDYHNHQYYVLNNPVISDYEYRRAPPPAPGPRSPIP